MRRHKLILAFIGAMAIVIPAVPAEAATSADLATTISDQGSRVMVGYVWFAVTVKNNGPGSASGVSVSDTWWGAFWGVSVRHRSLRRVMQDAPRGIPFRTRDVRHEVARIRKLHDNNRGPADIELRLPGSHHRLSHRYVNNARPDHGRQYRSGVGCRVCVTANPNCQPAEIWPI